MDGWGDDELTQFLLIAFCSVPPRSSRSCSIAVAARDRETEKEAKSRSWEHFQSISCDRLMSVWTICACLRNRKHLWMCVEENWREKALRGPPSPSVGFKWNLKLVKLRWVVHCWLTSSYHVSALSRPSAPPIISCEKPARWKPRIVISSPRLFVSGVQIPSIGEFTCCCWWRKRRFIEWIRRFNIERASLEIDLRRMMILMWRFFFFSFTAP